MDFKHLDSKRQDLEKAWKWIEDKEEVFKEEEGFEDDRGFDIRISKSLSIAHHLMTSQFLVH